MFKQNNALLRVRLKYYYTVCVFTPLFTAYTILLLYTPLGPPPHRFTNNIFSNRYVDVEVVVILPKHVAHGLSAHTRVLSVHLEKWINGVNNIGVYKKI